MKLKSFAAAGLMLGSFLAAPSAQAKEYVDYNYGKGVWAITEIEADPNHIDDYLTGLKTSDLPGFNVMKRRGLVDDWVFLVRNGYAHGHADVMIAVHYTSMAGLMPDPARDQAIEQEIEAGFSEAQGRQAIAGYEKYRQFLDEASWLTVEFGR